MLIFSGRNKQLTIITIHVVIGYLCSFQSFSIMFGISILSIGLWQIIRRRNIQNEAVIWSSYLVGSEILLRMSHGNLFHEFAKYGVMLLLFSGLLVEKHRHKLNYSFIIYIFFLLFGITFISITDLAEIRKQISFNLSGPILLGISALYLYSRNFSINDFKVVLDYSLYPIIAVASYLFFVTPDLSSITFSSTANFEASGGFGPNQVATALGFGIFALVLIFLLKKSFSGIRFLDYTILIYLVYRTVITFSRGGLITAILAILLVLFFFLMSGKISFSKMLRNVLITAIMGSFILSFLISQIGDTLVYRFSGKDSQGFEQEDISTGRIDFFKAELRAFLESPFFGRGPGGSKEYRKGSDHEGASHNEFSRLLVEHGLLGVIIIVMLFTVPLMYISRQPLISKGILLGFLLFWFLTINHSSMRMAFPGFIYGLSLIYINWNETNSVYRE